MASFIVVSNKMPIGELLHWPIKENLAQHKELIKGMKLISLHALLPNIYSQFTHCELHCVSIFTAIATMEVGGLGFIFKDRRREYL